MAAVVPLMDTYEPLPHDVELGLLAAIEGPAAIRCAFCGEDISIDDCDCFDPDDYEHDPDPARRG